MFPFTIFSTVGMTAHAVGNIANPFFVVFPVHFLLVMAAKAGVRARIVARVAGSTIPIGITVIDGKAVIEGGSGKGRGVVAGGALAGKMIGRRCVAGGAVGQSSVAKVDVTKIAGVLVAVDASAGIMVGRCGVAGGAVLAANDAVVENSDAEIGGVGMA